MEKFQNKYCIPSARANWHNYNGGVYFVTICTKNREHYLGEITHCCRDVAHICTDVARRCETLRATSLRFIFEDDITYHDSIKSICPNSDFKSLIIKFHLLDDIHDISMFVKKKTNRYHTTSLYKEIFLSEDKYALLNLPKNRLEYLGHNVGYCSIIVKLWSKKSIVLDMTVDYVEFEWIGG